MTVAEDAQETMVAFGVLQGNLIDVLWVHIECRNRGLGTRLMDEFGGRDAYLLEVVLSPHWGLGCCW